jgi:hypothetical protein
MGIHQGEPLGGALFALVHFRALCSTTSRFPSSLFPFNADDTHIIGPPSIVSLAYEHFQTELRMISLSIQLQKCATWSPFSLSFNFDTPSLFKTQSKGFKMLGFSLSISSFTSFFIKDVLLENVQLVVFFQMDDIQIAFEVQTHCFV